MRIVVLGATGMVGARVVSEAAGRGHDVVAVSRAAVPDPRAGVVVRAVDVADGSGLMAAMADAEATVLAVRPAPGREAEIASWTERVLAVADRAGCRVLVVGGAGPLWSPPTRRGLRVADDPAFVPPTWRDVALASIAQLDACLRHPALAWTYLSPPALLEPGAGPGTTAGARPSC